jgi:hypothetical protein
MNLTTRRCVKGNTIHARLVRLTGPGLGRPVKVTFRRNIAGDWCPQTVRVGWWFHDVTGAYHGPYLSRVVAELTREFEVAKYTGRG